MPPNWVIETQELTKRFGKTEAARGLNLRIEAGEIYGLIGPNGSGKTTLIRLLMGLLTPTSGQAKILGQTMPNKAVLSQVGYMTQAEALYLDLTLKENLQFFSAVYGFTRPQGVQELLHLVELAERANDLVSTLSGGLRRRVSLACALVHNPKLLLLDEPTVGIDPQLRAVFWDHFRQLSQQGVTLLISSHIMDEAERCSRLGFLREGRLLAEGSPKELKERSGKATLEEAFLYYAGDGHELD